MTQKRDYERRVPIRPHTTIMELTVLKCLSIRHHYPLREIILPEDDPIAIDTNLHFLYYGKLPKRLVDVETCNDGNNLWNIHSAYVAADKLRLEDLQSEIVCATAHLCTVFTFFAKGISKLTDAGSSGSKLRSLLLWHVAYFVARDGYEKHCMFDITLAVAVRVGGSDSEDILKAVMAIVPGQRNHAKTEDICELYHVHNKSNKCENAKKA